MDRNYYSTFLRPPSSNPSLPSSVKMSSNYSTNVTIHKPTQQSSQAFLNPPNSSSNNYSSNLQQSYQHLQSGFSNSYQKPSINQNNNSFPNKPPSSFHQNEDGGIQNPTCPGHAEPCAMKTVTKEGPNKGRQFYVCSRSTDQCKCFIWADETTPNSSNFNNFSSNSNSNWNNNSNSNSNWNNTSHFSSNSSSQGLCFKCNQPGHFATSCPNKVSSTNNKQTSYQSSSSSITCFKCNQPGHYATNCPNGGNKGSQEFSSSSSFASGPSKKKGSKIESSSSKPRKARTCSLCGQEGHTKRFHEKNQQEDEED